MATSKSKNTGRTKKNSKAKKAAVQAESGKFQTEIIIFDPGSLRDPDGK